MDFIGKFGEYLALSRLLQHGIEAYPAIKTNQESYDLTVVLASKKVLRIQVKSTELNNKSTNNTIGALDKDFDFLVIVIQRENGADCYVLSRDEAKQLQGTNKLFGVSKLNNKIPEVKSELAEHLEQWERIRNAV